MEYWSEKCPYCGAKTRKSSIDNEKTFDTPLVTCRACGKTYIHPDRIEIGMLSTYGRKRFARKMMFSMAWRSAFFGLLGFAVAEGIANLGQDISTAIGVAVFLLLLLLSTRVIKNTMETELKESEKRLAVPGYRERLEKAGYKPHW